MKLRLNSIGLLVYSSLFVATPAGAAKVNFDSWNILGDTEVINYHQVNISNNGLFDDDFGIGIDLDFNFSNHPAVDNFDFALETSLGLSPGALDLDTSNFEFAYEGSAIYKTINVKAGDKLNFEWNFLTNETSSSIDPFIGSLPDYSFFLVDEKIIKLADFNDVTAKMLWVIQLFMNMTVKVT